MIKKSDIKKQLESFFIKNDIKYTCINKIVKSISIPTYILKIRVFGEKTKEIENEISIEILMFHSAAAISFEVSNIYKIVRKKYCALFAKINLLNRYSLPGKFIINDDDYICYRCVWNYQNYDSLDERVIENIMDSIIPAYYLCLNKLGYKKANMIYEKK